MGERKREQGDSRSDLGAYQTLDLTLTARHILSNATFRGGIKNVFDSKVVYAAPLTNFGGMVIPSYVDDYPRPGREYWIQADVRF